MSNSDIKSIVLIFLCALVHGVHNLDYSDLEALGVACPERDQCHRYENDLSYMDRSCECDSDCSTYNDCCIDSLHKESDGPRSNQICLHYGANRNSGVYVVSDCSSSWNGPMEVRRRCEGPANYSDPLSAAPATSVEQNVTYKNFFCAECNNANLPSLKHFQVGMTCGGLDDEFSTEQLFNNATYSQEENSWGIHRLNSEGELSFVKCSLVFNVPGYLNDSVRFCRANIISTCVQNWTRDAVKRACEEYMAVMFDIHGTAYRNPHCAICNRRNIEDVDCYAVELGRRKSISIVHILDINWDAGSPKVGIILAANPKCKSQEIYDPFFKRCAQLACPFPGYAYKDGKCRLGG